MSIITALSITTTINGRNYMIFNSSYSFNNQSCSGVNYNVATYPRSIETKCVIINL